MRLTEKEAWVLHHLDSATKLFVGIPNSCGKDLAGWVAHREALAQLLMVRVVKREHPEG